MGIKERVVDFEFDKDLLADDMRDYYNKSGMTIRQLDEMIGVDLFNTYMYPCSAQLPTTRNLIIIANLLDVDPRKYFVLEK